MAKLRITTRASTDLHDIIKYIANDNPRVAEKIAIKILEKCKTIAAQPTSIGRRRKEFGPDLRSALCRPYIIFFRNHDDTIEILYIIHGSRDIGRVIKS